MAQSGRSVDLETARRRARSKPLDVHAGAQRLFSGAHQQAAEALVGVAGSAPGPDKHSAWPAFLSGRGYSAKLAKKGGKGRKSVLAQIAVPFGARCSTAHRPDLRGEGLTPVPLPPPVCFRKIIAV